MFISEVQLRINLCFKLCQIIIVPFFYQLFVYIDHVLLNPNWGNSWITWKFFYVFQHLSFRVLSYWKLPIFDYRKFFEVGCCKIFIRSRIHCRNVVFFLVLNYFFSRNSILFILIFVFPWLKSFDSFGWLNHCTYELIL